MIIFSTESEKIMDNTATFSNALELADHLPIEEQEMLINVLKHRLVERRRKILVSNVENSRQDFENGVCLPASVEDIMKEVLS
jgi:hypothetical protein